MKASIIQIGNSQGLRIPKPILEQCGFNGEVELEVHNRELILKSADRVRKNREKAFHRIVRLTKGLLINNRAENHAYNTTNRHHPFAAFHN